MSRRIVDWLCSLLLATIGLHSTVVPVSAADAPRIVYVVPIEGVIDLGLAPFVQRVLDEAAAVGAAAVSYTHLTLPTILRV